MEKIKFTDPDTGECLEFYVLEQTRINNRDYLLVTVDEDGDSRCICLKRSFRRYRERSGL